MVIEIRRQFHPMRPEERSYQSTVWRHVDGKTYVPAAPVPRGFAPGLFIGLIDDRPASLMDIDRALAALGESRHSVQQAIAEKQLTFEKGNPMPMSAQKVEEALRDINAIVAQISPLAAGVGATAAFLIEIARKVGVDPQAFEQEMAGYDAHRAGLGAALAEFNAKYPRLVPADPVPGDPGGNGVV